LAGEIREYWPQICGVAIVHRVGRLHVGETAVVIARSAAHREQVFDALHYAIDRLKEVVPIWKKEVRVESHMTHPSDGCIRHAEWRSEQ
jgi:molybdopterin synthase catalytic subunit